MTQRFFVEMRRYFYTTPSSYLELLKLYRKMLSEKHEDIVQRRERIANGLKVKLNFFNFMPRAAYYL